MFEVCAEPGCAIFDLLYEGSILGVYTLHHHVQGRLPGAIVLEDTVGFLRPDNFCAVRFPPETACVTEPLSLCQIGLAPSEFLSEKLVLRNVHPSANDSLERAILDN